MSTLSVALETFASMDSNKRNMCRNIFDKVILDTQQKKLDQNLIFDPEKRNLILTQLNVRPALLVHIADVYRNHGSRFDNFVEVGTAQGMQSVCFAECFPDSNVYTCDIKDDRDKTTKEKENIHFFLSNSIEMSKNIKADTKFDLCWIDGAHDTYSVITDFISIFSKTHAETVWVFDDFDNRFGCHGDIMTLSKHFSETYVLELGSTASGNPSRIAIMTGFI
jgi:predicted O-methyltransferase YrrM